MPTRGRRGARRTARTRRTPRRKYGKRKQNKLTLYSSPSTIIKPRAFVKLKYIDTDTPSLNLSTLQSFNYNGYNINGAYDVNQAVASTTMPGFTEWSAFYERYRVRAAKMSTQWVNNTGVVVYAMTFFRDDAVSPIINWTDFRNQEGNPYTSVRLLPNSTGMNMCKTKVYAKMATMTGSKIQYLADSVYAGTLSTNPSRLYFGYNMIGTFDGAAAPASTTVVVRTTITMYVEFFDRVQLTV